MEFSPEEARVSKEATAGGEFSTGDFVWGKIKNHPWWPGQVQDASRASQQAKSTRRREEQSLLVSYFGDGTFAWCEPSQLKHFSEEFKQMSRQSASKSFILALKDALDAVHVSLESEIVGKESGRSVENAGIEEGTLIFGGRVEGLKIGDKSPGEILDRIREVACDVTGSDLLEATWMRAWISAKKVDKSPARKRTRSLAELIADTPEKVVSVKKLDSSGRQQRKNSQVVRVSEYQNADVDQEEGCYSGKRERKRSRYLSPPYIATARSPLPVYQKDREEKYLKDDQDTNQDMLRQLSDIALDSKYFDGDILNVQTFFNRFREYSHALCHEIGDNAAEELRSEPDHSPAASEPRNSRSGFNLERESEPTAELAIPDHSPASFGSKSISGSEKFGNSEEAAVQQTLGSGPARSGGSGGGGQKHPLEFIKKSLEAMISALRFFFPAGKDADSSEILDPEARENLIFEMSKLLRNVDGLLAGSPPSDLA